jgi:membrane dipeptidase
MSFNETATRRGVLSAGAAMLAFPAQSAVPTIYRRAIVIDGNLSTSFLFDPTPITSREAGQIRGSGLTVFKQTLGGSTGDLAAAEQEVTSAKDAIARNPSLFMLVEHAGQIAEAKRSGKVGVILSFEAASMHEGRVDSIDHFAGEGVRVMGLSYNLGSPFGAGTLQPTDAGLTPLGREAVARMNGLGVTVDLSHSNDLTGLQAIAASRVPALITHAGCAAVHPHPRNKSDALLRAIADQGGTFGVYDLSYLGGFPDNPTLDTYLRHLTHALKVCGEDHVGIGSDTDLLSVDTSADSLADWNKTIAKRKAAGVMAPEEGPLPYVAGLNGPERWDVISKELARRGYSSRVVEKVLGANFQRVFNHTWAVRA